MDVVSFIAKLVKALDEPAIAICLAICLLLMMRRRRKLLREIGMLKKEGFGEFQGLKVYTHERHIEPDQRLRHACGVTVAASTSESGHWIENDLYLFLAIYALSPACMVGLQLDDGILDEVAPSTPASLKRQIRDGRLPPEKRAVDLGPGAYRMFKSAIKRSHNRLQLGTRDFLIALIEDCTRLGDDSERSYSADLLALAFGGRRDTALSELPKAQEFLKRLKAYPDAAEDFQYTLALDGDRLVFRVTSVLGDYVQRTDGGILVSQRAILSHFKDRFGGFTLDEIEELEELINNPKTRERQFQNFFERHPHFFRRWDYREVHPHVYLTRDKHPLVPDFILSDRELQKAAIVDLKLPKPKLIRRQDNRERFAAAVQEARAQLLRYRDWFRETANREKLKGKLGMAIYEPHLAVIVGRSSEFLDDFDRQRLRADNPDIEVVTYDDIVNYAERRRIIIQP